MKKRLLMLFVPVVLVTFVAGCGGDDDPMEPEPPAVQPPPDLTGSYSLVSLTSVLTGGSTLAPPVATGTFTLTQTSVSGEEARGNLSLSVEIPGVFALMDQGTFTIRTDGSWQQAGEQQQAIGTYTVAGDVLTVMVAEPPAAVSTTVWQRQ